MKWLPLVLAVALAAGCDEEVEVPAPVAFDEEAVGHFCLMRLDEHEGPKAQIHLKGLPVPLFFTQVRDAIAYLKGPERSAAIAAVYVSDMAEAPSWEDPGRDNWIAASDAVYVVGTDVRGGMGAPELVPFGSEAAAARFSARRGGKLMRLGEIPADAVLGAVEIRELEAN